MKLVRGGKQGQKLGQQVSAGLKRRSAGRKFVSEVQQGLVIAVTAGLKVGSTRKMFVRGVCRTSNLISGGQ